MPVDFFFVLSGFVLMHVYGAKLQSRAITFLEFFGRRVARVYPLHLATFVAALLLWALGFGQGAFHHAASDFSWVAFFAHLSATHALFGIDVMLKFNMPSWSVSSELLAYSLFPILCPLVASRRLPPIASVVIAAGGLALAWAYTSLVLQREFTYLPLPYRVLSEFILGMALYRFIDSRKSRPRPRFFSTLTTLLVIAVLGLSLLGVPTWVLFCFYSCLVLTAAEAARDDGKSWLTHPALVYLGRASYSIYMVHYVVLTFLLGIWPVSREGLMEGSFASFGGVYVFSVLAVAIAAHHLIELPARRLGVEFLARTPYTKSAEARSRTTDG